jgi:hypothetical protein
MKCSKEQRLKEELSVDIDERSLPKEPNEKIGDKEQLTLKRVSQKGWKRIGKQLKNG